jgi:predicted NAD/FAD-dependent oxidoreductase
MWMSGEPLFWITDNLKKGVSPAGARTIVTIHAGQEFSRDNWDAPEPEVTASMLEAAAAWLGSAVEQTQLHRWRYGVPLRVHPETCLAASDPAPIVFAGDAFGGPRVEAAALSGLAAGTALADALGPKPS